MSNTSEMWGGMDAQRARALSERDLSKCIVKHAEKLYGYRHYHSWTSMYSPRGFPDLVLIRTEPARIIFAELKSAKGKLSPPQETWIAELREIAEQSGGLMRVCVWRPDDWFSGAVDEELR